jgi:hypothetical protein
MAVAKWSDLIGMKIVAFRGLPYLRTRYAKKKVTELQYILFSDKKTILNLEEQDSYAYHDCNTSARDLYLFKDKELWNRLFNKEGYSEPDNLGGNPF